MQSHRPLRLALRLNAGFSTLSAVSIGLFYSTLSERMGTPVWILIGTAVGLAAFAAQLVYTASGSDIAKLRRESFQHSMADFAWVVGSLIAISLGVLTPTGNWILAAVAVPVLALGLAQWRSLPTRDESTATAGA